MAIDTRKKRASTSGIGIAGILCLFPSGALDQADLQTVGSSYSGILAGEPAQPPVCITALEGLLDTDPNQYVGILSDTEMLEGFLGSNVVQLQGFIERVERLEGELCC